MGRITQFLTGVFVEQCGDTVVVHAEGLSRWWGVLPAVLAGLLPYAGIVGLLLALPLLAIAFFLFLPRKTTTVFDMRSHRVLHRYSASDYAKSRAYAFADIAGLGVQRHTSSEGGSSYQPVLKVAQGTTHALAGRNQDQGACVSLVGTVCQATGLAHIELPVWGS